MAEDERIKISVPLVIEIDPEVWHEIYGSERRDTLTDAQLKRSVRNDVRKHVLNSVQQLASIQDSDAEVTLKERK